MNRIGIIGSGIVGQTLANGFIKHGYQVKIGTSHPEKLEKWLQSTDSKGSVGSFSEAGLFGDLIVLAVKGSAAIEAIEKTGEAILMGKTIIDTTNPIADVPPENGVLSYFSSINESLMERLQSTFPTVHFVKAFSCVGNAFMVHPNFPEGKPTMFICGNSDDAKNNVKVILEQFGWETEDMGFASSARAIEPLCILWCLPGFLKNEWGHAFKLFKL